MTNDFPPDQFLVREFDAVTQGGGPGSMNRAGVLSARISQHANPHLAMALLERLGDFHAGRHFGANIASIDRVELDGIVRERIVIETLPGLRMPCYILRSSGRRRRMRSPAVILWHGHGYGSRAMVGLDQDGNPTAAGSPPTNNIALAIARHDIVVAVPEVVGFGDRRLARNVTRGRDERDSCHDLAMSLMCAGKSLAGLRLAEAIAVVDFLSDDHHVEPKQIGTMGYSGGGMIAMLLSAFDTRISASVVGIYANTFRRSILSVSHCACNYIPGILPVAEMDQILASIAPRSLFVEAGANDEIFPVQGAKEAIATIEARFADAGSPGNFEWQIHEGGHEMIGDKSIPWLVEALKK